MPSRWVLITRSSHGQPSCTSELYCFLPRTYTPPAMDYRLRYVAIRLVALLLLTPALAAAQTNCDAGSGPLRTDVNVPDERALIEKVAARESAAVAARREYSFEQDVTV